MLHYGSIESSTFGQALETLVIFIVIFVESN